MGVAETIGGTNGFTELGGRNTDTGVLIVESKDESAIVGIIGVEGIAEEAGRVGCWIWTAGFDGFGGFDERASLGATNGMTELISLGGKPTTALTSMGGIGASEVEEDDVVTSMFAC